MPHAAFSCEAAACHTWPTEVFTGPVKGSCPLLELPRAEIVLLDDWRPDSGILDIATTLLWLEGSKFLICRPLNQFGSHMEYQAKQPSFITCNLQSLHAPRARWSESELSMLRNRLRIFLFHARIAVLRDIPPCPCCFAQWLISGGKNVRKFVEQGFPELSWKLRTYVARDIWLDGCGSCMGFISCGLWKDSSSEAECTTAWQWIVAEAGFFLFGMLNSTAKRSL